MSRRAVTLLIAGIGVLACLVVVFVLPVPYVALIPGPTYNTLGPLNGKQVVQISGHRTYTASGHLNMVTVSYIGGPGSDPPFNIFAALQAWLSPHEAVVPQQELFPPGQSQQQVVRQDYRADGELAADGSGGRVVPARHQVPHRRHGRGGAQGPARGRTAAPRRRHHRRRRQAGQLPVHVLVDHQRPARRAAGSCSRSSAAATRRQVSLRTASYQGNPVVGVQIAESFKFPFTVKISVGNIGGPSAGMMFALAIIDKLTPANLTGGKFIAGTGEITPGGSVQPIGGIQQKMAAARAAGATVFLAPAGNCADTAGSVPAGLRVVKVSTLSGAIAALKALKAGKPVPSC